MESRLRKFLQRRDRKPSISSEIDLRRSISSQSTSINDRPSTAKHSRVSSKPSIRSSRVLLEQRASLDQKTSVTQRLSLQAFPYHKTTAGKAPTFGATPVRGNGPVKLQTSRRTITGDLLATTEDTRRTLEEIREGEYIISGEKRVPRRQASSLSQRAEEPAVTRAQSTSNILVSSPGTPKPKLPSWSSSPAPETEPLERRLASKHSGSVHRGCISLDIPSESSRLRVRSGIPDAWDVNSPDSTRSPMSSSVLSTPTLESIDENTTINALWRAEYNQFIKLYGPEGIDKSLARVSLDSHRHMSSQGLGLDALASPVPSVGDCLPHFIRTKQSFDSWRSSAAAGGTGNVSNDDASDASSNKRASYISSCAGSSSYTTQTSVGDHESLSPRDDIRKIVADMRTNYLKAIEAQPPPSLVTVPVPKKKKSKRTKATSSPLVEKRTSVADRQTWHGDDHAENGKVANEAESKQRATSQPVVNFGQLSPGDTPPTMREKVKRPALERADSMTLGSILFEAEREVQAHKGRQPEDPEHVTKWLHLAGKGLRTTHDSSLDNDDDDSSQNFQDFDITEDDLLEILSHIPQQRHNRSSSSRTVPLTKSTTVKVTATATATTN